MPEWLRGNVLDVRRAVTSWAVAMNDYKASLYNFLLWIAHIDIDI